MALLPQEPIPGPTRSPLPTPRPGSTFVSFVPYVPLTLACLGLVNLNCLNHYLLMNATDKVNIESCWAEVVAQWLECRPTNLVVVGSNPTRYRTFFLLFPFLLSLMKWTVLKQVPLAGASILMIWKSPSKNLSYAANGKAGLWVKNQTLALVCVNHRDLS